MGNTVDIELKVNNIRYERSVEPRMLLSDFLRHEIGLTGTHVGCEHGVCGACSVLFDGDPIRSCLMFAVQAAGHEILTIEGIGTIDNLHPLQQSFIEAHGLQCGFCTPGMILSAKALLDHTASPSEDEIRVAISGNLCRCTGYQKIVKAIQAASRAHNAG